MKHEYPANPGKYVYPAQTFSAARRALMLPHIEGEDESITRAMHECKLGLNNLDDEDFDDHALRLVGRLRTLFGNSSLSVDEQVELSQIVDELAGWFRSRTA